MMGTPCEFMLLNSGPLPLREGIDFARVNSTAGNVPQQLATLRKMLDTNEPRGVTPLTERVRDIYQRIRQEHSALVAAGQRVILVIATDGLPTSPGCSTSLRTDREAFVQSLRKLML